MPRSASLAGAFQTPRVPSVRAQTPATCPPGGTVRKLAVGRAGRAASGLRTTTFG